MISLEDKVAVVTGSAQGLGNGIAEKLASLNAHVILSDINSERLEIAVSELKEKEYSVDSFVANVANRDEAKNLIQNSIETQGKLDILVNNAGINRDAMIHKMSPEQWDSVIEVNLTGVFNCLQPAANHMKDRESGRIINISSASWQGNIGQGNYAAAKAGVVGLSKTTSRELAKFNVTCNAICPGFIETDMTRGIPDKVWDKMVSKIPMGRAGKPEDVANYIAFLASDQASYVTGEVINVGGGFIL
ncbi:3-oxoacyl-ACP reductase FabG [Tuberibacillus sp. Marseille-P3662]|uniref:3-oxoacyl-ACP reductase FabG n=1 Tax=Tuberibacillus sp. Marseille-P3662 TaxID=1965358 RepID=UPI000A1CB5A4|nr:3-oxoacyl-ACP reductase FabG [Tuberibacillus sp. Marseille-P3662]